LPSCDLCDFGAVPLFCATKAKFGMRELTERMSISEPERNWPPYW